VSTTILTDVCAAGGDHRKVATAAGLSVVISCAKCSATLTQTSAAPTAGPVREPLPEDATDGIQRRLRAVEELAKPRELIELAERLIDEARAWGRAVSPSFQQEIELARMRLGEVGPDGLDQSALRHRVARKHPALSRRVYRPYAVNPFLFLFSAALAPGIGWTLTGGSGVGGALGGLVTAGMFVWLGGQFARSRRARPELLSVARDMFPDLNVEWRAWEGVTFNRG